MDKGQHRDQRDWRKREIGNRCWQLVTNDCRLEMAVGSTMTLCRAWIQHRVWMAVTSPGTINRYPGRQDTEFLPYGKCAACQYG